MKTSILIALGLLVASGAACAKDTRVICTFHPGDHVVCKDRKDYRPPAARTGFGERVYSNGLGETASPSRDGFGQRVWRHTAVGAFTCAENGKSPFVCTDRNRFPVNCERDENNQLQCSIPQEVLDADDSVPGTDR